MYTLTPLMAYRPLVERLRITLRLGLTLLLLGAAPSTLANAESSAADLIPPAAADTFRRQIAGTWVRADDGYSWTINIRADGTLTWWGSWFFGDGTEEYLDGPVFGTWRRSGANQISTIEVGHLNNGDGSFYATGRVQQVFTFDDELGSFSTEGLEELFGTDQDPTDPDEVPFDAFTFADGPFKRLRHMD